jgi:hypothetical protein
MTSHTKVKNEKDGKLTVEIKGVDVYDPATGQIRSSSTDDIACWFIDTDYKCQPALKIDTPSASKIDPPWTVSFCSGFSF